MKPETLKRCIAEAKRFMKYADNMALPIGDNPTGHIYYGNLEESGKNLETLLADLMQGR